MKISMVRVDLSVVPKRTASKASASLKSANESSMVAVPIFVNLKALSEGDELMYHKAAKSQGVKRPFDPI